MVWHQLAASIGQLRLLLIGTRRPTPSRPEVEQVRTAVLRRGRTVIALKPLPDTDSRLRPPSAESRLTAGARRMFPTFTVLGLLKISTIGSCHANQTGTLCGRPSGCTVPSQMTGSADSRRTV